MVTFQTILSILLIVILISLMLTRIKLVKQNDHRLDKSSIIVLLFSLFSLIATKLQPTYLDVIALYVIWTMVNFFTVIYSTLTNYKVRPRPQMEVVKQDYPNDEFLIEPIQQQDSYHQVSYRTIDITPTGEYTVFEQQANIIRPNDFQIPISKLTNRMIILETMKPDLVEVILLFGALLVNYLIMVPITDLNLFHPYMLMYWGILSFIFYTIRWSYTGPFQFAARMKQIEQQMMNGKHVVDFKIIGMITSLILIVIGTVLLII